MGPADITTRDLATVTLEAHGSSVELVVDPNDHIGRTIASGHFYERDLLEDVFVRDPRGIAVDVGAHIGNHSCWFAGICGLDVVAIEPNPASFALLVENARRNGLPVRTLEGAAGAYADARGRLLELREGNSGMTRVVPNPAGDVEFIRIDDLELPKVGVIKVDTEGDWANVLVGANETIGRDKPLLYIEATESLAYIDEVLAGWGYERFGRFCKTPTYGYAA